MKIDNFDEYKFHRTVIRTPGQKAGSHTAESAHTLEGERENEGLKMRHNARNWFAASGAAAARGHRPAACRRRWSGTHTTAWLLLLLLLQRDRSRAAFNPPFIPLFLLHTICTERERREYLGRECSRCRCRRKIAVFGEENWMTKICIIYIERGLNVRESEFFYSRREDFLRVGNTLRLLAVSLYMRVHEKAV